MAGQPKAITVPAQRGRPRKAVLKLEPDDAQFLSAVLDDAIHHMMERPQDDFFVSRTMNRLTRLQGDLKAARKMAEASKAQQRRLEASQTAA